APSQPAAAPASEKKAPATAAKDGARQPASANAPAPAPIPAQLPKNTKAPTAPEEDVVSVLRGPAKAIATNMVTSLEVPTATSVRAIPAKLLIDNRVVINSNLARARGGKVSFTHLIGYAVIRALS
ncbi:2-oxo acid dehydrogenase subunit E2, partial [Burkholderia sp. SIMBA_057]